MSLRPESVSISSISALCGTEGELVSVRITVESRLLEELLETLALVSFPVNPQIYHVASGDSRKEGRAATAVEFPAYVGRMDEVRRALHGAGFHPDSLTVRSMLEGLHATTAAV